MISSLKLTDEEKRSHIFKEILCHIPDEVLQNYLNLRSSCDKDERIMMFIDVSGFTSMTERYSKHSRAGIDELTSQLNRYFTIIVDHILAANGDVLKFAGDAILASWLGYNNCTNVIECAIAIQHSCNHYVVTSPTISEGLNKYMEIELNVRIAVSVGKSRYIHLTSDKLDHFIVIGEVVDQLKDIEKESEISVVLVSTQFWSVLPTSAKLQIKQSAISSSDKWLKIRCNKDDVETRHIENSQMDEKKHQRRFIFTMIIETQENLDRLFKLVIEPVVERIAHLEPLIYASEMTELSICFINAHIEKGTDLIRYQQVIAVMFYDVSSLSHNYDGVLSKVVGFDKGLSFLCLFGLGSSNNPYVCALDAALAIRAQLLEIGDIVMDISVGVTSGIMYCGVVGHPDRHEYTTIGRKVNLAARFMCAYPNIVSCDRETMLYSKLNRDNFTQLEFKQLKGIGVNVEAYEYGKPQMQSNFNLVIENNDLSDSICNREFRFFGRRLELLTVCCKLIQYMGPNVSRNRGDTYKSYVLVFRGEDGSGRSMLVQHLFRSLQKCPIDREVMFITCLPVRTLTFKVSEYAGLTKILAQLLKIKSFDNDVEYRRMLFRRLLQVHDVSTKLRKFLIDWFYLRNDIAMQTNANDCSGPDDAIMIELIDLVLCYLQPKQFIVLVDDLHHMDDQSLRLVARLSRPPQSIIIGVARSSAKLAELSRVDDAERYVELKNIASIKEVDMHDLICDILKVQSIDKGLLKVIYQRTRGMPVLCVEALLELRRCSLIAIANVTSDDESKELLRHKRTKKRNRISTKQNLLINIFFETEVSSDESVPCTLRHLYCLSGNPNRLDMPNSIESAFMREYNRLCAFEKSLLANCSVLDLTFSKMYLFGTCRGNISANTFNTAIKTLFEKHMLTCAYNTKTYSLPQIKCCCPHNSTNLPFFCRMYKFWHDSVSSIVYSSMTRETVRYRRLNAINWLEEQLPKVIATGHLFGGHLGLSVEAIKLPISHTADVIAFKRSFINILGLMRIKSYEQMMTLSQLNCNELDVLTSSDIDQTKQRFPSQSRSNVARKPIFKGMLDTHVVEMTLKWIKFSDGLVKRADFLNIFERWRRIDIAIRLDYYPFTACMILDNVPLNEFSDTSKKLTNSTCKKIQGMSIDENVIKLTKKHINLGIYIPCRQQMIQIMEEIVTHASIMGDHERILYYSLQLAIIHITTNLALKAKSLLDTVDELVKAHEVPMILLSMFYLVKARFEQYITNNYQMAVQYFNDALKYVHTDNSDETIPSLDFVKDTVVSIYMAQFVYIDLYRVTLFRRDVNEEYQDVLLQTIANNLINISKQLPEHDILTVLVVCEEYHTVQEFANIFRKTK